MITHGDCVEVMAAMSENSVDAIVCDPPYGLEFMGKEWDRLAWRTDRQPDTTGRGSWFGDNHDSPRYGKNMPAMQEWHHRWATEALRVAKPGAYLLAFGGTRTYHRLAVAIEDAGWIIRDCLVWAYASGFPKSKALLKPAWEPIVMARKPGPLRELAIDACRIGVEEVTVNGYRDVPGLHDQRASSVYGANDREPTTHLGRWPANVVLTDPIFDGDTQGVVGGGEVLGTGTRSRPEGFQRFDGTDYNNGKAYATDAYTSPGYGDTGTYSRFFLVPKAARSEREPVFGGLEIRDANKWNAGGIGERRRQAGQSMRQNHHPTVKPVDLMRHLVRLVTPQGGTVLDPFLGSGTTAIAAEMEGFAWLGIEREAEYVAIAEARLMGVQKGLGLDVA